MNEAKKYTVGEIMAAFAIIFPSIVSFWFINLEPSNKNTNIAAFGCILHCPFSFLLLGYYSSFVMHMMLSIPQFCLLSSIKQGSDA